ncbi:aminopeptidase P family protein [Paenibacillus sp. YN15]|uniref:aminopeptidase P family protein n=1 Tax=Paenibacillus sp. YN15 TaxID=1742774 RepID=UPI000DCED79C|nr:aminopeptidase P family protein [Paenibacillus sp. YN15]RAV05548.1 aminopeptidase P family protein [Paenibacillus sp. YN15]
MNTSEKLSQLRTWMEKVGIDACLVPSADAHMSEYVGEYWKSRQWISGFTGSAGTAVIAREDAGLWTDGRYFIQAANQLEGSGIRLFKMGELGVPGHEEWLAEILPQGGCLAVDGRSLSVSAFNKLSALLADKSVSIRTDLDPVGAVWKDRPAIPGDKLYLHEAVYAGKTRTEKLAEVRKAMKARHANFYLLPVLDEICWLFNIRGNDIPHNPYVTSYAVIGENEAYLFVDPHKVDEAERKLLAEDGVQLQAYGQIYAFLAKLDSGDSILLDPEKTNAGLYRSISASARKILSEGLVTPLKAIKNEVEIPNIRDSYIKDAVALVKLFKWLKDTVPHQAVTEIDADLKGLEFRKELPLFVDLSFSTISAYGDHAAMMHYRALPDFQYTLKSEGFYLLDSGSHFLNGTTDITRTLALGNLTEEQKKDFTLVLKSVIALSTAKFLYGTTGSHLDVLARKPMWDKGLDYKCGTGHGVGYFSNVHEEPHRFNQKLLNVRLEPGMTITVEPGVYKEGRHGIRTENTLLVIRDETTEFGSFLRFETLCFLPIDRNAIDPALLSPFELDWINEYHQQVYDKLSVHLDDAHKEWLKQETAKL